MSNLPRHTFWGAGEPDCPPDLKAPNGELHTMRCKVCGDGWRDSSDVCMAALGPPVPRYSGWLWTHVVKGGDYRMLGEAKLQTDRPLSDMAEVIVYQGADGKLWVRDAHEFRARFSRTRPDPAGVQKQPQPAGWHVSFDHGATWGYHAVDPWGRLGERAAIVRPLVYGDGADWRTPGVRVGAPRVANEPSEKT